MSSKVRMLAAAFAALTGVSLGFTQAPFNKRKPATVMTRQESQQLREKAHFYFLMRNYQGVLDLTAQVPTTAADYEQIQIIRRMTLYKLSKNNGQPAKSLQAWDYVNYPAAVRDSLFDALYASSRGDCFEAFKNMQPVSKYTNVIYDDWIYNNCKESRDKRQPASEKALEILKINLTENKSNEVSK